jgi:hypothetical protein
MARFGIFAPDRLMLQFAPSVQTKVNNIRVWRMSMTRFTLWKSAIVVAFSLYTQPSAPAQIANLGNNTSTPVPGVGHDYVEMLNETVNPANGAVSFRLNTPVARGRQLTLPFSFTYDSNGVIVLDPSNGEGAWRSNTTFLSKVDGHTAFPGKRE